MFMFVFEVLRFMIALCPTPPDTCTRWWNVDNCFRALDVTIVFPRFFHLDYATTWSSSWDNGVESFVMVFNSGLFLFHRAVEKDGW